MLIYSKNVLSTGVVTSLEVLVITILLIGLDYMVPAIVKRTSAFSTVTKTKDIDYQDLNLSYYEKKTLDLFKDRVAHRLPQAYMNTDFYLIRWIRITEYDIDQAEKLLTQTLKWREDNKMDEILNEDFSDLRDDYVLSTNTHDKKGRPIVTVNLGHWDLRAAALQGKIAIVTRYTYWYYELLVSQIFEAQQNGKNVTRAVILIDLDGYNFFQQSCPACLGFQLNNFLGIQTHYPMFWESFIIINTPSIFNVVVNAAGGIMKQEFKDTLKIFTQDKNKWMDYLDERIERDQRYTNFGGTKHLKEY